MIVDSTGQSFGRASEWYEQKYGRKDLNIRKRSQTKAAIPTPLLK
jgi:hypothetical protein